MSWDKRKDELREQTIRQTNVRKKTGTWCRGKVGKEHEPEIVVNHNFESIRARGCGWRELMFWRGGERHHWKWQYSCCHAYRCKTCGKYTQWVLKDSEDCPDFKPQPEGSNGSV